jgi:hypothetical protein
MELTARFKNIKFDVQLTSHAKDRMKERSVSTEVLISIIENGEIKSKPQKINAFWVFAEIKNRSDNLICLSLVIEGKSIVIKTVLINWRPV